MMPAAITDQPGPLPGETTREQDAALATKIEIIRASLRTAPILDYEEGSTPTVTIAYDDWRRVYTGNSGGLSVWGGRIAVFCFVEVNALDLVVKVIAATPVVDGFAIAWGA